jgi:hypothetical protein
MPPTVVETTAFDRAIASSRNIGMASSREGSTASDDRSSRSSSAVWSSAPTNSAFSSVPGTRCGSTIGPATTSRQPCPGIRSFSLLQAATSTSTPFLRFTAPPNTTSCSFA